MKKKKLHSVSSIQVLRIILLSLIVLSLGTGGFQASPIHAQSAQQAVQESFPASERVRTEIEVELTHPDKNDLFSVYVRETSFDTGEKRENTYEFESQELNSKFPLLKGTMKGAIAITPNGIKYYAIQSAYGGKSLEYLLGTTVYEFDLKSKKFTKIIEATKLKIDVYAEVGLYKTYPNFPDETKDSYQQQLYSIQTHKAVIPKGTFGLRDKITMQVNAGKAIQESTGYLLSGVLASDKSSSRNYFSSYSGQLTPLPKIYNKFIEVDSRNATLNLTNGKGQLINRLNGTIGNFSTTITWKNGNTQKTILNTPGVIHEYNMPSFSPNNRYMLIYAGIYGDHHSFSDGNYYIYDVKTMTLIQKFKPYYKLDSYAITWYDDELLKVSYITSNLNVFPGVFYHIPSQTSTKSTLTNDDRRLFVDNFTYKGMITDEKPRSLLVDGKYIRYSRNGIMNLGGSLFIPLQDFAQQQGITVNIAPTEIELSKGDKHTVVPLTKAKDVAGNWYVPIKEVLPLGYKLYNVNGWDVMLETTNKS